MISETKTLSINKPLIKYVPSTGQWDLFHFFFPFTLILAMSFIFCLVGQFQVVNWIILFSGIYGFLFLPELNIFLFVVFLFNNGMISTEYNIAGYLHVNRIINLLAIITILKHYKRIRVLDQHQILAARIAAFILAFLVFDDIKSYYLRLEVISLEEVLKRLLKNGLQFTALIMLLRRFQDEKIPRIVVYALVVSGILLSVSIVYAEYLQGIGLEIKGSFNKEYSDYVSKQRYAGFFMDTGDENSAGGFLAAVAGVVLLFSKKYLQRAVAWSTMIILFFGILFTISRAAIIAYAGVLLLAIVHQKKYDQIYFKALVIAGILVAVLWFTNILDNLLFRFSNISETMETQDRFNRLGGWLFYYNYIIANLSVILFGTTESIYWITRENANRVAHNFYITLIYRFGIFPFMYLLILLIRSYKKIQLKTSKLLVLILFLPFLMISNTVSDSAIFVVFILIIPLAKYIPQRAR